MSPDVLLALGALILGLAIAWGVMQSRNRNRANDAITEKATRDIYRNPNKADAEREDLKDKVKPS